MNLKPIIYLFSNKEMNNITYTFCVILKWKQEDSCMIISLRKTGVIVKGIGFKMWHLGYLKSPDKKIIYA